MAAPAPVPALPDTPRLTTYAASASAGPYAVGFAVYGDSSDYQNWVQVFLDGVQQVGNWTLTSPSGSLVAIARPITDAVITFTDPITGTLVIVSAQRPRRLAQNDENRGVTARDWNQAYTALVAGLREIWDLRLRLPIFPAGESTPLLPPAASRALMAAGFDADGNWIAQSYAPAGAISSAMAPVVAAATTADAVTALGIGASVTIPIGHESTWPGLVAPNLWKFEDGSAISRTGFPELLAVLAPTLACVAASGSATVSGFSSTVGFGPGWPVEGVAFAAGTTIDHVVNSTTIVLSQPAIDNGSSAQLFIHGNGDGSSTFNLPLLEDGSVVAGLDSTQTNLTGGHVLNAALGAQAHTLITSELPVHAHPVDITSATETEAFTMDLDIPAAKIGTFTGPGGTGWAGDADGATGTQKTNHTHRVLGNTSNAGAGAAHSSVQRTRTRRMIIYAGH